MPRTDRLRAPLARVGAALPEPIRGPARSLARRIGLPVGPGEWWLADTPPWSPPTPEEEEAPAFCNVCRWTGERFGGIEHVESADCPRCGSIARDRFLIWCFLQRTPQPGGLRILETSPRLGEHYRRFMRRWWSYRASDFDLSAHVGDIQLDLQDIALPTASVDIVLTPHVLEHVPDTARALAELFRVVAPGGRVYLQVPLLHGVTSVPTEPEFHADNTPVFFNFGWDLTDLVRAAGFEVDALVTAPFRSWLVGDEPAPDDGGQFDLASLVGHACAADLTAVAGPEQSARLGFRPPHHFVTWECRRP